MKPWGVKRLFRYVSRTRDDVRREVSDEIAFHLVMREEALRREGMSAAEAKAAAIREFGTLDTGTRALADINDGIERRRRIGRFLDELRQDTVMGARLLVHSPGFAAVAILTLALGVGANTTIYSGLDAALLRPLPYPSPDRLVLVSETREDGGQNSSSGGAFLDWRSSQGAFEALALTGQATANLRLGSTADRLIGMEVSHEFLQVLGIPPLLGRGFQPADDRPGGHNAVVMLTEELWRSRFNADPSLVGRTIVLDEVAHEVIGVLPRHGWMLKDVTFFVPAVLAPGTPRAQRAPHWAAVFGRLAPGVTAARAQSDLLAIKTRLNDQYPSFKKRWGVMVQPVTEVIAGLTRTPLLLLLGAVLVVLLIACANVANLLLARSCHRQQELAVRAALGASGARLVRQVLTENLVLTLLGGTAGVLLAYGGVAMLRWLTVDALPLDFAPRLDARVLAGALVITLLTGPLVGLLPALRARRPDPGAAMGGSSKGVAGGSQRTKAALVVLEVALTVTLLASAGLLLRSLGKAESVDPGFQPDRILAFDLSLPDASYASQERRLTFASELLTRLRALPGVEGAGTGLAIPYATGGYGEFFARPARTSEPVIGRVNFVSPGYLEALGARLIAGRRFDDGDNRADGPRVTIISEQTRRMFYAGENPVGQTMVIRGERWEVIGVVSDVVERRPDVPAGAYAYMPSARNGNSPSVIVRTALEPLTLLPLVRAEVARIDQGVAVASPRRLDRARTDSVSDRRIVLALLGAFAAAALVLASLGVYGVMAYAVATRRREFGIRLACGAARSDVMRDVFRSGLIVTSTGVVLGLAGAAIAARLIGSQLYHVGTTDPFVAAITVGTVIAAALAACGLPAWRASRIDPASALRAQ